MKLKQPCIPPPPQFLMEFCMPFLLKLLSIVTLPVSLLLNKLWPCHFPESALIWDLQTRPCCQTYLPLWSSSVVSQNHLSYSNWNSLSYLSFQNTVSSYFSSSLIYFSLLFFLMMPFKNFTSKWWYSPRFKIEFYSLL